MKIFGKVVFIILFFISISVSSQTKNDIVVSSFAHYGMVILSNGYLKGENRLNYPIKKYGDLSFRYEIQTNGSKDWHALYDFPSFGFGFNIIDFKDKGLLKQPIAAYSFLSYSYFKSKRFDLRGEYALGLTTNWDYFSRNNLLNVAIGSPVTCYFDYGLHIYYKINRYFDAGLGVSMTHFSNGALIKPNRGINVISPRITLKYNASHQQINQSQSPKSDNISNLISIKPFHFTFTFFGGVFGHYYLAYNNGLTDSIFRKEFFVGGFSPAIIYNFNIKHGLGIGLDFAYFSMTGKSTAIQNREIVIIDEASEKQRLNAAVFLSYEYRINHFTLNIEPCLYLWKFSAKAENPIFDVPIFYQRIGVRWQATKNFYVGLKLRAFRFSIAHFIEWNFGIRL